MKNKKGLSQVVGTLMMVLVAIALIAGLWGTISSFVNERVEGSQACYGIYDQLVLDSDYTCFNSTSNETYVSISRKDIDLDSILVSVAFGDDSIVFEVKEGNNKITDVTNYFDRNENITLPSKSGGRTYRISRNSIPTSINIAPKINGKQCDSTDSLATITYCY